MNQKLKSVAVLVGLLGALLLVDAGMAQAKPTASQGQLPALKDSTAPISIREFHRIVNGAEFSTTAATCNYVYITSHGNGLVVSAELNYGGGFYGMLRARSTVVDLWETFYMCHDGTYYTLQSAANGLFVAAELNYGGSGYAMLRARSTTVDVWERFTLTLRADDTVDIMAANGLFVAAELNYGGGSYAMLRARSATVDVWEKFL